MNSRMYLNGEWEFMPDYAGRTPQQAAADCLWEDKKILVPSSWRFMFDPEAAFQPYDLFAYPREWNQADSGVIGRQFDVNMQANERIYLVLEGVLQRFVVFVNGQQVIDSTESYLPVEIEITPCLHHGENDLKIWCGPYERIQMPYGRKALTPTASWFASLARGAWQDVYLEYRPSLAVQDVFIRTSVRKQEITVEARLSNFKSREYTARLCFQIFDESGLVKEFTSPQINLKAMSDTQVEVVSAWLDPKLWSPEFPHLYHLKTLLEVDGKQVHEHDTRFGFREVWLEGHKFFLNGVRINLRGDAWHYQGFVQQNKMYAQNWYRMCKETGINIVRLHAMPYPEFYLDAADELGMLIIDESAIYGSGKAIQADHPEFIENCRVHLQTLVKRDRNHPSVVIWSMQNEMRWVDGRDGYKRAMPELTRAIKELDDTRPVSYDGDNRLVDEKDMEIVSMHYNIDGTVADWSKEKPLIFGEHGPWHYVSPQTCSDLAGADAYLSFDACQESMGLNERLFNEYARKEEVTGLTPFNTANYTMWTMPGKDIQLSWEKLSEPGVKPGLIPAHTLTINNGFVKDQPLFLPNPSWEHIRASFKPVTVFRNEYNDSFYGGTKVNRTFSIYNDTEKTAQTHLLYRLEFEEGGLLDQGEVIFEQLPGERGEWKYQLSLPEVEHVSGLCLHIDLLHGESLVHQADFNYRLFPALDKMPRLDTHGKQIAMFGGDEIAHILSTFTDTFQRLDVLTHETLKKIHLLVLGDNCAARADVIQPVLQEFVSRGGVLVVLEQNHLTLGDLTLSGKPFFSAFITNPHHPIFHDLTDQDFRFWGEGNIHAADADWLIQDAFNKPVQGDFRILLECGQGNFGWGGLLWTPLLEYTIGKGKALFNQLSLVKNFNIVPQAAILLRNLLQYGMETSEPMHGRMGLIANAESDAQDFFAALGADHDLLTNPLPDILDQYKLLAIEPGELAGINISKLESYARAGGILLLLPVHPQDAGVVSDLVNGIVGVEAKDTYQVQPHACETVRGIPVCDLDLIEKVTYSPAGLQNTVFCSHALTFDGGESLFSDVHNPWHAYFIQGLDAEYHKEAIATMNRDSDFVPRVYGLQVEMGEGILYISQVRLLPENEKIRRVYTRLLSNLGVHILTPLLTHQKTAQDNDIPSFMGLKREAHQDFQAMLDYFSDPLYLLNNLGEGVYGWMIRLDKREGVIEIPGSAGQTWFLTVFIDSEINHDPTKRAAHELPDSSIVPDLYLKANCGISLYVNGIRYLELEEPAPQVSKTEDVLLQKGVNRMLLVCRAQQEDIRLNSWFENKYGDAVSGLRYRMTLD